LLDLIYIKEKLHDLNYLIIFIENGTHIFFYLFIYFFEDEDENNDGVSFF